MKAVISQLQLLEEGARAAQLAGSITILWTYYLLIQSPAQAFQSSQEGNLRIIKL